MADYLFNNEIIDIDHPIFDALVFDEKTQTIKYLATQEEIDAAKLKKADYLIEQGQITIVDDTNSKKSKKQAQETLPIEETPPIEETLPIE